jgi:4-amino-4-deoxy-L-arabinose transferase-like glycosyltransferase
LPTRQQSNRLQFLGLSAAILWIGLLVRMVDLSQLPVFVDEGNHIAWAQAAAAEHVGYPFLMDGKILLGLILTPFTLGSAPLWAARAAIAVFSSVSCAACIALGSQVGSRRVGLLAGLIYTVLPYAVFHERQALADPLSAAWGSLAMVLTVRLTAKSHPWLVGPLALALAGAVLAKLTSVYYLIYSWS